MLRYVLLSILLNSDLAAAAGWCHSNFVSAEGYTIAVDYQIHGRPSRAGTYRADPIWINISGASIAQQNDVSIELTDVAAHQNTARNQILALNLFPADGGQRYTIDGKFHTSANNSQKIRVRIGSRWLENPKDGTDVFDFNMGHALWDLQSSCRFE